MSRASNLAGFTTSISSTTDLSVGIVTATTFRVGTAVTINSSGISAGVITATSFSGSITGTTGTASTATSAATAFGLSGSPNITVGSLTASSLQLGGTTVSTPGVGIATASGTVGTGATILDFRGAGISTVTVASGIATINVTGGSSGTSSQWITTNAGIHTLSSVGIGTTNPTVGVTSANTAVLAVGIVSAFSLSSNVWSQPTVAVSALDIDCSSGNYFTKTIATDSTFTFSNPPSSRAYSFALQITHTSGILTWPASVKWPGNTAPTLTTGRTHIFMFGTITGGSTWYGSYLVDYT